MQHIDNNTNDDNNNNNISTLQELINTGDDYIEKGEFEKAIKEFRSAIKKIGQFLENDKKLKVSVFNSSAKDINEGLAVAYSGIASKAMQDNDIDTARKNFEIAEKTFEHILKKLDPKSNVAEVGLREIAKQMDTINRNFIPDNALRMIHLLENNYKKNHSPPLDKLKKVIAMLMGVKTEKEAAELYEDKGYINVFLKKYFSSKLEPQFQIASLTNIDLINKAYIAQNKVAGERSADTMTNFDLEAAEKVEGTYLQEIGGRLLRIEKPDKSELAIEKLLFDKNNTASEVKKRVVMQFSTQADNVKNYLDKHKTLAQKIHPAWKSLSISHTTKEDFLAVRDQFLHLEKELPQIKKTVTDKENKNSGWNHLHTFLVALGSLTGVGFFIYTLPKMMQSRLETGSKLFTYKHKGRELTYNAEKSLHHLGRFKK